MPATKRKLRPINETRKPNGQLTSETSRRLLSMRGGRSNWQRNHSALLNQLVIGRIKSLITRRAKALLRTDCKDCHHTGKQVLALMDSWIATLKRDNLR